MRATEILSGEHRVIEQVLTCLEKMTAQAVAQGRLEAHDARDALEFFRNFADRCHHGKEEHQLFPAMEKNGFFSPEAGPTAVMRYEHEDGRNHIRAMSEALEGAAQGDTTALRTFAAHAHAYVQMLREHIQKEDHCLFSMANNALSPADQEELLRQFEAVEHEEMGEGAHERYQAIADQLAERWGVTKAPVAGGHSGCGCHHHH